MVNGLNTTRIRAGPARSAISGSVTVRTAAVQTRIRIAPAPDRAAPVRGIGFKSLQANRTAVPQLIRAIAVVHISPGATGGTRVSVPAGDDLVGRERRIDWVACQQTHEVAQGRERSPQDIGLPGPWSTGVPSHSRSTVKVESVCFHRSSLPTTGCQGPRTGAVQPECRDGVSGREAPPLGRSDCTTSKPCATASMHLSRPRSSMPGAGAAARRMTISGSIRGSAGPASEKVQSIAARSCTVRSSYVAPHRLVVGPRRPVSEANLAADGCLAPGLAQTPHGRRHAVRVIEREVGRTDRRTGWSGVRSQGR